MVVTKLFLQGQWLLFFMLHSALFLYSMEELSEYAPYNRPEYDVSNRKRKFENPQKEVVNYLVLEKKRFLDLRSKRVQEDRGVESKVVQEKKESDSKKALEMIQQKDFATLVYWLREGEVDLNHCDKHNKTSLYYAVEQNLMHILYTILFYGSNPNIGASPLFPAIDHKNMRAVRHLCEHKADPNACENNKTPLYYACEKNATHIMYAILSYGGNPNVGMSPLFPAIQYQNEPAVQSLLEYGAYTDVLDEKGNSPIARACEIENISIVKLLLRKAVDHNK